MILSKPPLQSRHQNRHQRHTVHGRDAMLSSPSKRTRDQDEGSKAAHSLVREAMETYFSGWQKPDNRATARKMIDEALSLDPDCYSAYALLGYLESDEKNYEAMMGNFFKALELADDPRNEYTWDMVTVCLHDGLGDDARLSEYLTRFYRRKPETNVLVYLVKTLLRMKQPERALSAIQEHLLKFPDDRKIQKLRKKVEKRM